MFGDIVRPILFDRIESWSCSALSTTVPRVISLYAIVADAIQPKDLSMKRIWLFPLAVLLLLGVVPQACQVALGQELMRPDGMKSIREFGVSSTNSAEVNRAALQKAIDWAAARGAALFVEPTDEPYLVAGGLVLKMNASLIGVHGPVGRGTRHETKTQPVGSVFRIVDESQPFITVESATQLRGIQFWYPNQTLTDRAKIVKYPPTIQVSHVHPAQGVTLSCLTFFGEYIALDFDAAPQNPCEQILFEHCYGYPLSGEFIRIDYCYDIPRILHCHVNPANQRLIRGAYSPSVVDAVIGAKTFAYTINHTDNAILMDVFAFGTGGGAYLGPQTYGQLTGFNFDCVTVGIHKLGDGTFNRNWQIAQGAIIANTGPSVQDIHPFVIEGEGHTAVSNVEAFSGKNNALASIGQSNDFALIKGERNLTVSFVGCRMRNYRSAEPITSLNRNVVIQAVACVDKNGQAFNLGTGARMPSGSFR